MSAVVDASFIAEALVNPATDRGQRALELLDPLATIHVPSHWRVEVLSILRGLAIAKKLTEHAAQRARRAMADLYVETHPIREVERIWELRHNLTTYDAAYVALAETLDVPLFTADKRIKDVGVAQCAIEVL